MARVATLALALALSAPGAASAAQPLLTVGVDATSATLNSGTYSLLVVNHGDAPAAGVMLTADVPANTTFASSDRTPLDPLQCAPGAAAGTTCRWAIGTVPAGGSATVGATYALNPSSSDQTISLSATAQTDNAAPASGDPTDRDASLVRTNKLLTEDTHVDDRQAELNYGACATLTVQRDGVITPFLDSDLTFPLPYSGTNPPGEVVWAAELRAVVSSVAPTGAPPMQIGAHRIAFGDWDEGSGTCAGAAGSRWEPRGSTQPPSDSAPAAVATVTGPGAVAWDVTSAVDTRPEQESFNGFELRPNDSPLTGAASDTVLFHSNEAAAAVRPRLVVTRIKPEERRCIDSDSETAAGPSDGAHGAVASVTDGDSRVTVAGTALDGCTGTPLEGAPVGWDVDDDLPDVYISDLDGTAPGREVGAAGDAGPNNGSTVTGPDGRTSAAIRLADPYTAGRNSGESRLAAIALSIDRDGSGISAAGPDQGTCDPGDRLRTGVCEGSGEDDTEDDVHRTWNPVAAPSGGGNAIEQPAGAAAAPASPAVTRSITLAASRPRAAVGGAVGLAGRLTGADASCGSSARYVQIRRRMRGAGEFVDFASVTSAPDGGFELPLLVDGSATYVAHSPADGNCKAATSSAADVLAVGRVSASASRRSPVPRGTPVHVRGHVTPAVGRTVVLERRLGRRWVVIARQRLVRRSRFDFTVRAVWSGRRTFRVRWISPAARYAGAASAPLVVRTSGRR